ncbi:hypothetical protein VTN00DRAFT_3547 [Thermoascus crustaceus]|uniref:uncharacterized protein n=1 Tax=Thermoascus crustaceus TaxID=5088 RepID=UPI0037445669
MRAPAAYTFLASFACGYQTPQFSSTMPMWTCNVQSCKRPAVRTSGDCIICNGHLCAERLRPTVHHCPGWQEADLYDPAAHKAEQEELAKLFEKINTSALAARASSLQNGIPCSIPSFHYDRETQFSVMGGMNYHVNFDLQMELAGCEVATLDFLEQTHVTAPKVFDFALEGDSDPVGVGYILMEKMPGISLNQCRYSEDQMKKVISQLADIYIELHRFPFDHLGSLDQPGRSHIGPFAREILTDLADSKMQAIGPCSSLEEYHVASIRLILDLILREELYTQQAAQTQDHHQTFYLKHADDKGDHILVDKDFNITGIIDWEWAHTISEAVAFKSPMLFLPVLEEKGYPHMAEYVRKGRVQHQFAFSCGYDIADWDGFLGLFRGLRDTVGVDNGLNWTDWKVAALDRYRNDMELQLLLSRAEQNCYT